MSDGLATESIPCILRPARAQDDPFLFRLFAESQDQLALLTPNEPLWHRLVEAQYLGREMTYQAAYPDARSWILCFSENHRTAEPVGRLLVSRVLDRWRVVDLAVLRTYRGRGVASWALRYCQKECAATRTDIELEVAPQNPARQLYLRVGFRTDGEDLTSVRMRWRSQAEE